MEGEGIMDTKKLSSKQVREYWKQVRRQAWNSAWEETSMRAIIVILALLLFLVSITGIMVGIEIIPLDVFEGLINETIDGFKASGWAFLALVVLYLIGIYRIPAEIYYKQQ